MKKLLLFIPAVVLAVYVQSQPTYFGKFFSHTVDALNKENNYTHLSHPDLDGNANAKIIVTPTYQGVYDSMPLGVWYDDATAQWNIFREQESDSLPLQAKYHVLIPSANGSVVLHKTTASNTTNNHTVISHPKLDGHPEWVLFVTHNWNPSGNGTGVYNDHNFGVSFDGSNWSIYNEDQAALDTNIYFNVFIPDSLGGNVFVHMASTLNMSANLTRITSAKLDNNPYATVFATHNYSPFGMPNNYSNHAVGIAYDVFYQKWFVFNQDMAPMDTFTAFNILVAEQGPATAINESAAANVSLKLFPNPVGSFANISYLLPTEAEVDFKIVNELGQLVTTIFNGRQQAAEYNIPAGMQSLPKGIYHLVLTVDGQVISRQFVKQ